MYNLRFGRLQSLDSSRAQITDLEDRFQHAYVIGPTKSGKSTLMVRMAVTDIRHGVSCVFVDPKGEHLDQIYNLLTDEEKERVVYFSYNHPSIIFNPLRKKGYDVYALADELSEVLNIIIAQVSPTNPPASENMKEILREAIPLLREEDREIETLYKFLRFNDFREKYFQDHYDGKKNDFWKKADKAVGGRPSEILQTADKIAIRLGKLIQPDKFKKLFSGPNGFDVEEFVRNKKVLLVDTSGFTDDKLYYIIGLLVFGINSYCRHGKKEGHPLIFYFDECHMGINDSFIFSLAFTRSSKVGFVLANQFVTQFKNPKISEAILSQCGTKVVFTQRDEIGKRTLANALGLKQDQLREMKKYEAWVNIFDKLSLVKTFPLPEPACPIVSLKDIRVDMKKEVPGLYVGNGDDLMENNRLPEEEKAPSVNFLRDCWFSC